MAPTRRSTRNASPISTPAELAGPKFTASGRQIRAPATGIYGESLLSGQRQDEDASAWPPTKESDDSRRPRRTNAARAGNGYQMEDSADDMMADESEDQSSGNEWQVGEEGNDEENDSEGDEEEGFNGDDVGANGETPSLVVQLRYGQGKKISVSPNNFISMAKPSAVSLPIPKETKEHDCNGGGVDSGVDGQLDGESNKANWSSKRQDITLPPPPPPPGPNTSGREADGTTTFALPVESGLANGDKNTVTEPPFILQSQSGSVDATNGSS